jgi:hypothetical protein
LCSSFASPLPICSSSDKIAAQTERDRVLQAAPRPGKKPTRSAGCSVRVSRVSRDRGVKRLGDEERPIGFRRGDGPPPGLDSRRIERRHDRLPVAFETRRRRHRDGLRKATSRFEAEVAEPVALSIAGLPAAPPGSPPVTILDAAQKN